MCIFAAEKYLTGCFNESIIFFGELIYGTLLDVSVWIHRQETMIILLWYSCWLKDFSDVNEMSKQVQTQSCNCIALAGKQYY